MPEPENKTKIITLRYRPTELQDLNAQAKAVGLSRSAYITRKLQGLPVLPTRVPQVNWMVYRELIQIAQQLPAMGNNLNQIARAINTAKIKREPIPNNLPSPEQLQNAIAQIEELKTSIAECGLQLLGIES